MFVLQLNKRESLMCKGKEPLKKVLAKLIRTPKNGLAKKDKSSQKRPSKKGLYKG